MPTNTTTTATTNLVTGPVRYYSTRTDGTQPGYYVDHQDIDVAAAAYALRVAGASFPVIAAELGLQHWDHAQAAVRAHCRRTGAAEPTRFTRRSRRTHRRFGIEIEFNARRGLYGDTVRSQAAAAIRAAGVRCEVQSYNHDVQSVWKMTTDATVSGGECVSPIMSGSPESLQEVRTVINAIKQVGGETGRNVGMHVHHDVTDFIQGEMATLVMNLQRCERALGAYVPTYRTNGQTNCGAQYLTTSEWVTIERGVSNGSLLPAAARSRHNRNYGAGVSRYRSINFNPVLTYGTVEFRLLGNTLNTIKVRTWVKVGQALIAASKAGHEMPINATPETMCEALVAAGALDRATATKFTAVCAERAAA